MVLLNLNVTRAVDLPNSFRATEVPACWTLLCRVKWFPVPYSVVGKYAQVVRLFCVVGTPFPCRRYG